MAEQKEPATSDAAPNAGDKAKSGTKAAADKPELQAEKAASGAAAPVSPAAALRASLASDGIAAETKAKDDGATAANADRDNVISIVDDAPAPAGPAMTPLERARRNPLLNWLNRRAAAVMIAAGLGALVGAMASNGLGYAIHLAAADRDAVNPTEALRASVGQLAMEIASLKAAVAASSANTAQISGLDQFRSAVSGEITGSVDATPPTAVSGWTVLRVANGRALVQGERGSYEVAPGSTLPGLGMVQRIVRQDGRWAVQTRAGMIIARD